MISYKIHNPFSFYKNIYLILISHLYDIGKMTTCLYIGILHFLNGPYVASYDMSCAYYIKIQLSSSSMTT